MADNVAPVLVVHGGAGEIPEEAREKHVAGCRRAAEAGWAMLARGGLALAAVEAAVRLMEDDPTFDAGRGSFLNAAGEVEMDAIIMDGRDLNLGAVASVQRVRNPVTLARLVMTESGHAFLTGRGAETFAWQHDLPTCTPAELLVERELQRWRALQEEQESSACELSSRGGTVGAVALDRHGNVATATSTGGTPNKLPGRVGDCPLVGCGAYADNASAAASASGLGEALMKVVISKTACDMVAQGRTPQEAADAAVAMLARRTGGHGGLIVLDRRGRFGMAHNTPCFAYAAAADQQIRAGLRCPPEEV